MRHKNLSSTHCIGKYTSCCKKTWKAGKEILLCKKVQNNLVTYLFNAWTCNISKIAYEVSKSKISPLKNRKRRMASEVFVIFLIPLQPLEKYISLKIYGLTQTWNHGRIHIFHNGETAVLTEKHIPKVPSDRWIRGSYFCKWWIIGAKYATVLPVPVAALTRLNFPSRNRNKHTTN